MTRRSPFARRRAGPAAAPAWLVRASWVLGTLLVTTIVWLLVGGAGEICFGRRG